MMEEKEKEWESVKRSGEQKLEVKADIENGRKSWKSYLSQMVKDLRAQKRFRSLNP
jgi:hypothetical protein